MAELKLNRDQLEMLRRRGAAMRNGSAPKEDQPAPPAPAPPPPTPDDSKLTTILERMTEALAQPRLTEPTLTEPYAWHFEIERDNRGLIKSVITHPIKRN